MKLVSVVITTTGRVSLARAIASVQNQSIEVHEIIVVSNNLIEIKGITFIHNAVSGNVCSSRNLGLAYVKTPYVAFLDDDDYWLPTKNEKQLHLIPKKSDTFIISCKTKVLSNYGNFIAPRTMLSEHDDIREYLFGSKKLYPGDRFLQTSSILLPTKFAKKITWDQNMPRHNDWDFFIRAADLGAIFLMALKVW